MSLYEGMFVMDNRQANRDWDGSLEKVKGLLTKHGAEVVRVDKWGERKLAYEIGGRRRGTYVLIYFNAGGRAVNEIYRECELLEMVVRSLIIKIESLPSEEAVRAPVEYGVGRRSRDVMDDGPRRPRPRGPEPEREPEAEAEAEAPAPAKE